MADDDLCNKPASDCCGGTRSAESRRQIRRIEECLINVLFGDFTQVVTLDSSDPIWGNLAMHINVAINAARQSIERAEASEGEASQARDEALKAAHAESQFLTNVTHELRTPLASIRACAEILRDFDVDSLEARTEFLGIIVQESERLTRLIEDVLDVGRFAAGRVEWRPQSVRIEESVEDAVRVLSPMARRQGVEIRCRKDGSIPITVADHDRLTQVWTNLIGNAVKFSPVGGDIEVVVACRDGRIAVEVADRGPGIPEAALQTIFERFRQITSDILTDKPSGSGLGLAIAREIVEHHFGEIEIESELGVGSTFRVVLPVVESRDRWNERLEPVSV